MRTSVYTERLLTNLSVFCNSTCIFFHGLTAVVGLGLLGAEASLSHSVTPHSVRLLWTSDQPDANTSSWQHTTLTTDRHPCPSGIQTRSRRLTP